MVSLRTKLASLRYGGLKGSFLAFSVRPRTKRNDADQRFQMVACETINNEIRTLLVYVRTFETYVPERSSSVWKVAYRLNIMPASN